MYIRLIKRLFDILFSMLGVIIALPIVIFVALLIVVIDRVPPFFFQDRLGMNNKIFKIVKLRTMKGGLKTSPEITYLGRFLRRFKIDETPQFINVLFGSMSIIGPRPCLPELTNKFDENGRRRVLVRPGIAGLADVNGGNYITWKQRWVYDRIYVENVSFHSDLKILKRIIIVIFLGEDYYLNSNKILNLENG